MTMKRILTIEIPEPLYRALEGHAAQELETCCPEGMALAGSAKAFDRQLDSWITRAVDLGMIASGPARRAGAGFLRAWDPELHRYWMAGRRCVCARMRAMILYPGL
jgi:hypothetical protein